MRVFIAGLCHETSSFSPVPTNRSSFEDFVAYRPSCGRLDAEGRALNGYGGFARAAEAQGDEVIASQYYWAQPSGPCVRRDYEALRDGILADLAAAGGVQMVLLFLHGAQMAQGYPDCEGDLLRRVRETVGPDVFVGALLDLHANLTEAMIASASALVACRHYPHIDFDERGEHLYALGRRAVLEGARPTMRYLRAPMMGMFNTTEPLMTAANARAAALQEAPGVLSVSLIHGFQWADIAENGAGVLVVAEREPDGLDAAMREVARAFFDARAETRALRRPLDAVLDHIEAAGPDGEGRPFVVADACDNPGGGAGSDSTFILEGVLSRGLTGFAFGLIWDPVSVQFAAMAGVGGALRLRLGGKSGSKAGRPLDVEAEVLAIGRDLTQTGIGFTAPMGTCVALRVAGNIVIVNDVRGQVFSPTCFTDLGVSPAEQRAVVVKSSQHFRDQFAPLARDILYCETPGPMTLTLDPADFHNLRRPVWPLDDVSFPA